MDIFSQPSLYISDIEISYIGKKPPLRKEKNRFVQDKPIRGIVKLKKYPILLKDGDFPSEKYKKRFLSKHQKMFNGKFDDLKFSINISNATFSSDITYIFDEY